AEPMLDALCGDAMHVSDLLKTSVWKHNSNTEQKAYTMRDELLQDRADDYASRGVLLRGYHEKARALAMYRASVLNVLPESAYTPAEKRNFESDMKGKTATQRREQSAAWLQENCIKRIAIGDSGIAAEHKRMEDLRNPASAAFKKKLERQGELRTNRTDYCSGKFAVLDQRLIGQAGGSTPEVVPTERILTPRQRQRLKDSNYRLAGMTEKEAAEKGIMATIGEAMFRTFSGFLELPATETMTEAEVLQLFSDLSADSQIEIPINSKAEIPPEQMAELAAARQINMRGCRQCKETIRLQCDYISRKYGTSIEKMDVVELAEHYQEMTRDMANLPVDGDVIDRIPGLLDPNNPEDELLRAQVDYYTQISSIPVMVQSVLLGSTDALEMARSIAEMTNVKSKAYLLAHSQPGTFDAEMHLGVAMGERRRPID
ncbi:MAG: hypothetical protein RR295_07045, partial [Oscillospiraceae bacterium]